MGRILSKESIKSKQTNKHKTKPTNKTKTKNRVDKFELKFVLESLLGRVNDC